LPDWVAADLAVVHSSLERLVDRMDYCLEAVAVMAEVGKVFAVKDTETVVRNNLEHFAVHRDYCLEVA